jgi:pimeloyl-ACP methyl ester carboxylesterase
MGQSEYMPGRTLLDYPSDISALADAMKLDRFGVIGWSGGGPHALACAYAIPDRLTSCLIIAGYTNFSELPNASQYLRSRIDQIAVGLARSSPRSFACLFQMMNLSWKLFPNSSYFSFANTVHAVDRELLHHAPSIKRLIIASQKEAFVNGIRGPVKDAVIQYRDWGFRLGQITTKVHIFHGYNDYLVPSQFSQHIASEIGQSHIHWFVDQGHFLPLGKMENILSYT